jgi:predicted transcriptional regulator
METWKLKIIDILKNNPQGLSINEITNIAKTTRHTVSIALAELKGEGRITIRQVGMAKLHYWRKIV